MMSAQYHHTRSSSAKYHSHSTSRHGKSSSSSYNSAGVEIRNHYTEDPRRSRLHAQVQPYHSFPLHPDEAELGRYTTATGGGSGSKSINNKHYSVRYHSRNRSANRGGSGGGGGGSIALATCRSMSEIESLPLHVSPDAEIGHAHTGHRSTRVSRYNSHREEAGGRSRKSGSGYREKRRSGDRGGNVSLDYCDHLCAMENLSNLR